MSIIEYLMNVDDADIDTIASYIDWDEVSQLRLEESFLSKYNEYINWQYYDRETFFTEEFIRQYPHYMDWEYISKYQNLSEDLIRDCGDYIIWEYICIPCMDNERYYKFYDVHEMMGWMHRDYYFENISEDRGELSEELIREFQDAVDWDIVSTYNELPDQFYRDFQDQLNWGIVSYCGFSRTLWHEFSNRIVWEHIFCEGHIYDIYDVEEFEDIIDWTSFSLFYQSLDLEIVQKYEDKIKWDLISEDQVLDDHIITTYANRLNWNTLCKYQFLSEYIVNKFAHNINVKSLNAFNKKQFKRYIYRQHQKKTFMLAENLPIPVDTMGVIASFI